MDKSCETIAHSFGIDKGGVFVEQGDGTKITLAKVGSEWAPYLNSERGTVAVGMRSGMVCIMTVVRSNHPRP